MLVYLLTTLNCLGVGIVSTWYNIRMNQFSNKKDVIKFGIGSLIYNIFATIFTIAFPNRSSEVSVIMTFTSYLGFMWLIARRNIFFSLWEILYYIIVAAFANIVIYIGYIIPFKIPIEQFGESITGNLIYIMIILFIYLLLIKLVGFQAIHFRDKIWDKHRTMARIISIYFMLLIAWAVFVMDILEVVATNNNNMDYRLIYAISIGVLVTFMLAVFFLNETIKQKEKYIDLIEMASTDEMTGVFNRRYGLKYLQNQINEGKEDRKKIVICYIDINNLKGINDRLGHDAGDKLICFVVAMILEKIGDIHKVVRLGGDEFLIIFQNIELEDARAIIEEVASKTDASKPDLLKEFPVNFSYGITEYLKEGKHESVDELIQCADREMYLNKSKWKVSRI